MSIRLKGKFGVSSLLGKEHWFSRYWRLRTQSSSFFLFWVNGPLQLITGAIVHIISYRTWAKGKCHQLSRIRVPHFLASRHFCSLRHERWGGAFDPINCGLFLCVISSHCCPKHYKLDNGHRWHILWIEICPFTMLPIPKNGTYILQSGGRLQETRSY